MALTVADLLAKLSLDTSGFRKGAEEAAAASQKIEGAVNKASEATGKTEDSNKKAGKSFGDLAQSLNDTTQKFTDLLTPANLFGTVIGVTVVGALKSAVNHAFEFTSELRRLSLVTGDSLGRVAEFQGAVDKLGIGSDKLSRAFFFLSTEMENGGANLAKLGIELRTAEGYEKSVIDITQEMSDKFRAMGAGADVAAAARKILGRQAIDMLPVFQLEREQVRQLGEEEERFSKQIGNEGLLAMTRFRGSLLEIGGAITRVQTLLVLDLEPGFKKVADITSAAIDSLLRVPAPIRHIVEAIAALTVSLIAATLATKAFAAALELAGLASWATGVGTAINTIRLLVAGLVLFITLGPMVKDALVAILPQSIIDAWQSFTGWIGSAYQAMKNFLGLGPKEVFGPPAELATKKYEPTLADEQKRLQYTQQLTAAQIALGQATMTSEAAQVNAIKLTLKQRLDELAVQARFDTTPTNLARTAALRAAAENTARAQIAQIAQQANLQLLTIEKQTAEQRLAIEGKSRDAALAMRIDEIAQAKKLVADEYAVFGVSQADYIAETIRLNGLELTAKQTAITKEMAQVTAAQQLKTILIGQQVSAHLMTQAKADEELAKLQVETDAKLLDLKTKAETMKREITNQNRELEKKAIQDELTFVAQAENRDLTLKLANLETYKREHAESVNVIVVATAEQYRLLKAAYDKDVQNYIDKQLYKTGVLENEIAKRIAQEAGLINAVKQLRQQYIDNQATMLEQQARQAGDLGKAYEVGFAHAASAADDAFSVMRKAGADAYQSLKSGLSDFLFDVFTGAKNISDVFVNLGKRILRSFTDVFAEIIARQAAMAAGFSLPWLLSAGSAAAGQTWQAATGPISNVMQLGNAANEASNNLSGFSGIIGFVTHIFGLFGHTLGALVGGITKLLSMVGIPVGAAGMIGSLVTGGGVAFGLGSLLFGGGAGGLGAGLGGTVGTGLGLLAPGFGTQLIGQLLGPTLFTSLFSTLGPMLTTMLGNLVLPGIGFLLGGVFGKLFGGLFSGPTPQISGKVDVRSTTTADILSAKQTLPSQVVNPPGRSHFSYLESGPFYLELYKHRTGGALNREESQAAILNIIITTIQTAIKGLKALETKFPASVGHALSERIDAMLIAGFEVTDFNIKGKKTVEKFREWLQQLSGETLKTFTAQLFPQIDLEALGAGDAVKGFEGLLGTMSLMGEVAKRANDDLSGTTVDLDKFVKESVAFIQRFAKEGEAFTDTLQRVAEGFSRLFQFMDQLSIDIASASEDSVAAIQIMINAYQRSVAHIQELADAELIAIESGASPEEIAAASQALRDAMAISMDALQRIAGELQALNAAIVAGIDLYADLEVRIQALSGATSALDDFIDMAYRLALSTNDVGSQISIVGSILRAVGAHFDTFAAAMPRLATAFNTLMAGIRGIASPAEAITQLKELAQTVMTGAQVAYQGIANDAARAREAAQAASNARLRALEEEKVAIQEVFDTQMNALQVQLDTARQWQSVIKSIDNQLIDLFNLLAPTHPETSFTEVLAQFRLAVSGFGPTSSSEAVTRIQELARQVLQLAQGVPGMDLSSLAFQSLAAEVKAALEAVKVVAENQPSEKEVLAQIATLTADHNAKLAAIDTTIRAEQENLQLTLESISAQEQQQIAFVNAAQAAALTEIRNHLGERLVALQVEQEAARQLLHQITGELSFEQFIAQKQADSLVMLQNIRDVLTHYLGSIANGLGFTVPQMAGGGIVMPRPGGTIIRVAEAGYPEMITPVRSGRDSSGHAQTTINLSLTVHANEETKGHRVGRDAIQTLKEAILYGELRQPIQQVSERR